MSYSMQLALTLATYGLPAAADADAAPPDVNAVVEPALDRCRQLCAAFQRTPVTPQRAAEFERDLRTTALALARDLTQWTYNHLEPATPAAAPDQVRCAGTTYRRLAQKTPQQVSTLFGPITLRRLGYRAPASAGEPVLFPLAQALGLVHGATPALVERVAHYQAETGATQRQTLARLRQEHNVTMGVKRLRQLTDYVATGLAPYQVEL